VEIGRMEYLAEDPTSLAGGLTPLAVAFLIVLRATPKRRSMIPQ
jgi:hypothetical protein